MAIWSVLKIKKTVSVLTKADISVRFCDNSPYCTRTVNEVSLAIHGLGRNGLQLGINWVNSLASSLLFLGKKREKNCNLLPISFSWLSGIILQQHRFEYLSYKLLFFGLS